VDDAIWRSLPAYDLALPGDDAAPASGPPWRAALAVVTAFLCVAFVGGGLFVGALGLQAVSAHQAQTGTVVPEPVRQVLGTVAGATGVAGPAARGQSAVFAALPDWDGNEPFTILLLGLDQRDNEREQHIPARSDTMILVRIDPRAKSAGMISLPRDLWVDIPNYGQGKINTAYTYGELNKLDGGGPGLAKRAVEQNFGLRVDYYARVDFHGFEQIVDTLGGIVVDVDRPIKDDEYPTDDYGVERLYVPAGLQFMDGSLALKYARSRHSESDFGRIRRQQRVLFAVRQRALQLNMLLRAPALVAQARDMVATDLSIGQLVRLAKLAQQIDSERVNSMVIDANLVREMIMRDGSQALLPDKDRIRRGITALIAGMNPQQATRIEVLNGSGRPGVAADTAKFLLNLGYEVTRIDDADRSDYTESVLEIFNGRRSMADDLAATLALSRWTAREARSGADDPDVRIIVGREFRLPQPPATPTVDAAAGGNLPASPRP
jgi:LCP family protein required for cell wall assembly